MFKILKKKISSLFLFLFHFIIIYFILFHFFGGAVPYPSVPGVQGGAALRLAWGPAHYTRELTTTSTHRVAAVHRSSLVLGQRPYIAYFDVSIPDVMVSVNTTRKKWQHWQTYACLQHGTLRLGT
eukprot:gene9451-6633_t